MADLSIRIENLTKKFGKDTVLHGITHEFEAGKIHGIVGNNGSGKTVMFKCICGFLTADGGRVFVGGEQIGKDVDFPSNLGAIIETPGFVPQYSGRKNLEILASINKKISKKQVTEIIRNVGLDPNMKKAVSKYSLGMRQRLGLAQAIMEDPAFLILDEPFNGLDKHGVAEIREIISGLRDKGKTILLASHNPEDIRIMCDTVCEMDSGYLKPLDIA